MNLSSNIHAGRGVFRLQAVYGEGVENYMNDAPVDIGVQSNPGNGLTPVTGEALPVFGFSGFYDHAWDERWSSAIGYSVVDIDNTDLQLPSAFKRGHYALANLLYRPVPGVLTGGEDHALVATFRPHATLPEGWSTIGTVQAGGKKTGVFVDGQAADDVVQAIGAERAGHVHFG